MSQALEGFIAAAPWPQRAGLRVLIALARRPRGTRLLRLSPLTDQLAGGLPAMEHFEDPAIARALGWDADAVAARGRAPCAARRDGRERGGAVVVIASPGTIDADVCVVGAGAGGAVAAAELAEGGAKVVVLEQGPHHDADRFSARPIEMMTRLYRDSSRG